MTTDFWAKKLGLELTPEQRYACEFCEAHGLRFLVDFTNEDAIHKAAEMLCWKYEIPQKTGEEGVNR